MEMKFKKGDLVRHSSLLFGRDLAVIFRTTGHGKHYVYFYKQRREGWVLEENIELVNSNEI